VNSGKLRRWTDVLVALLRRHFGATFDELSREVPGYAVNDPPSDKEWAAVKRMFERDKAELIAFGVPIETVRHTDEIEKYRLRPSDFYLPYLSIVEHSGRRRAPPRLDKAGYHAVLDLAFEPDELAAVAAAGARVQKLGDPLLVESAQSALRKLAFDLPQVRDESHDDVLVRAERLDPSAVSALDFALLRRKRLAFTYHSMSAGSTSRRTVEPLGLFFLNAHWYLAGREPDGSVVKNFRTSRMSDLEPNRKSPQTPDFITPPAFNLREHARSRLAWELGDADAVEAVVEFEAQSGSTIPWMRLGSAVAGSENRRAFRVRQMDRFVRWILSFAGAAKPVTPASLEAAVRDAARETLARYETVG
jgi:predicted DNA-binding transcriptional regulator YafY